MAMKFTVKGIQPAPTNQPAADVPNSKEGDALVATHVRMNEAAAEAVNQVIHESLPPPDTYKPIPASNKRLPDDPVDSIHSEDITIRAVDKLDRLVADDFPFDPSQLEAIYGVVNQRYACLIGAAGTGKTTSTKKIVDLIKSDLGEVVMTDYFKNPNRKGNDENLPDESYYDPDDDYEMPEGAIPAIALVGFTGRSTQMIKKNFPQSWHGNIMTIHRMLAYMPEYYEDWDSDSQEFKNKMRFVPTYTAIRRLPWDVIVIDEAGMVSIDLWMNIWAAAKDGCRIIMIGDINQLPPVHGRSIFGFAMTAWPTFELTHIHRQVGVNNSIVDAAHSILKGQNPRSDGPVTLSLCGEGEEAKRNTLETLKYIVGNQDWKFLKILVPEIDSKASVRIRQVVKLLAQRGFYNPELDTIITPTNGYEPGSRGYYLGQAQLNQELATALNPDSPRYIIDAGRDRKYFAEGDKVMATKNDHEAGITNGMTGIITKIERNGEYTGEWQRFGLIDEVAKWVALNPEEEDQGDDVSIEDIEALADQMEKNKEVQKESRDRGPASHVVTVRFGEGKHAIEMPFSTLAEVNTLMTAYAVTCHKMQGGESPLIMGIVHTAQKSMLNREWAYTMVTRASGRCIMFYTELGLKVSLSKQDIKGQTLREKIQFFAQLASQKAGAYELPPRESLSTSIVVPEGIRVTDGNVNALTHAPLQKTPGLDLAAMLKAQKQKVTERVVERIVEHVTIVTEVVERVPVVDGGDLTRQPEPQPEPIIIDSVPVTFALPNLPALLLEDKRTIDYTEDYFMRLDDYFDSVSELPPAIQEQNAANRERLGLPSAYSAAEIAAATRKPEPPKPTPTVVKVPFKFGIKKS